MATTPVHCLLLFWNDGLKIRKQNNLKVQVEGEVITYGEFVDLLEEKKASKEAEKKQKVKRDDRKEGEIININLPWFPTMNENIYQEGAWGQLR